MRNSTKFRLARLALTTVVAAFGTAANASAGLLASDSYLIGSTGQYTAGSPLSSQSSITTGTGFTGYYNHGAGTSNFSSQAGGLASTADGSNSTSSGSVLWTAAPLDGTNRSVARNLTGFNEGTTGTFWTSILVSTAGNQTTTNGAVLEGFGGTVTPQQGSTATAPGGSYAAGYLQGIFTGFSTESGTGSQADLIIRSRDATGAKSDQDTILVANAAANTTYLVVAEIQVNPGGSSLDSFNYWVNPTDLNSVADMNATAIAQGTDIKTYSFQGAASGVGDFTRLNYNAINWDGNASFDEARLGTTLASIAPASSSVPEPASIAMTGLGFGGFVLGTYLRRRRSSR